MKIILFASFFVLTLTLSAVDKVWNFSSVPQGLITANTDFNGLTILADPINSIVCETSSKPPYTQRFKPGSGSVVSGVLPSARAFTFQVEGSSIIVIDYLSALLADGVNRYVNISDGNTLLFSQNADQATVSTTDPKVNKATFNYSGNATTLYVYGTPATGSGLHYYMISATNVTTNQKEINISSFLSKVGNNLVNPSNLEVVIYSTCGTKVSTSSSSSISIEHLAKGIYIAKTEMGAFKFIK